MYRASARWRMLPLERVSTEERLKLATWLERDDAYGVLFPDGHDSELRVIGTATALLLHTLATPGPAPAYLKRRYGARAEEILSGLILEGLVEVDVVDDGVAAAGPDAGRLEDQGHMGDGGLEGVAVLEAAVVPELLAVVGGQREGGAAPAPALLEALDELADGRFEMVLADKGNLAASQVQRVVLCAGKVYDDLAAYRAEQGRQDVAIIRVEQLYPFPKEELQAAIADYENLEQVMWCQEEPLNQGAWYSSQHNMRAVADMLKDGLGRELKFAGRPASAAPAAGYMSVHTEQQRQLVEDAFNL